MGNSSTLKIQSARPVASESFRAIQVAAPTLSAAASYQTTISPAEVVRVEGLKDYLPAEQPFDKAYVTVQGTFDGVALREVLASDPDGDGPLVPLPLGWWRDPQNQGNDLINIVAVEVERQTVSLSDGSSASETVIVSSLPGRPSLLKEWSEVTRAGDVGPLLDEAFALSEWLQRPAFYESIAGPRWTPPAELVKVDEDGEDNTRRLDVEQRRLAKLDQEIVQLRLDLERAPTAQELRQRQSERDAERRDGSGQGGQRGGKGGGGERSRPAAEPGRQERELSKEAIDRQLKNKETERARAAKRIIDLGGKPPELAQTQGDAGAPQVAPRLSLLESPEIKLWAHDLTPSRGGVYKYRMRVVLNNPFFGRPLNPDQESLGHDPLARSAWSEWSEEIEVLPAEYFFITSAEEQSQLTPRPRATVEMFQYYYGYYRKATVSLEPGDMIMGEAKLPDGLKFADMSKLPDILESLPDAPPAPVAPPARVSPGRGPDGGPQNTPPSFREGQRGRGPAQVPGDRGPGERIPRDRVSRDTSQEAGSPILTVNAPSERVLKVNAVFLDAAKTAVSGGNNPGGGARYVALFRDLAGRIVTRSPEQDRSQKIYKQIDASARQGANLGKVEAQNPVPEVPQPPREDRNRYRPPPPGGGGGG
jgi:hypothetical protein